MSFTSKNSSKNSLSQAADEMIRSKFNKMQYKNHSAQALKVLPSPK